MMLSKANQQKAAVGGVTTLLVAATLGLLGLWRGQAVSAVRIETVEHHVAELSVDMEKIGVTMHNVELQQARIEPLLKQIQRKLDEDG